MPENDDKILIIGIGNCARADDGLGWAFIDNIKENLPGNFNCAYKYQLQIEDAELLSHYSEVYFIDAHKQQLEDGFTVIPCKPEATYSFSTHELSPETVLQLTRAIYHKSPESYMVGISGYSFKLKVGLSEKAKENLGRALQHFNEKILHLII